MQGVPKKTVTQHFVAKVLDSEFPALYIWAHFRNQFRIWIALKMPKTHDFLCNRLKGSLNCVVFHLCRLCTSNLFPKAWKVLQSYTCAPILICESCSAAKTSDFSYKTLCYNFFGTLCRNSVFRNNSNPTPKLHPSNYFRKLPSVSPQGIPRLLDLLIFRVNSRSQNKIYNVHSNECTFAN